MGERVYFIESVFDLNEILFERFNELLNMASQLQDVCEKGEQYKRGFTQIAGDIWVSFYAYEPLEKNPVEKFTMHNDLINSLNSINEFKEWLPYTQLDIFLSALATITICEHLLETIIQDEKVKKYVMERNIAERKHDYAANRLLELNEMQTQIQQQVSVNMLTQAKDAIEKNQLETEKVIKKFKKSLPTFLQDAKKSFVNTKEVINTFCTLEGNKIENVPLKEQFELAKQLSQQELLIKVAEMAGRFKKIAKKKLKVKSHISMDKEIISLGNKISNVIPLELANYILPPSRLDFLKRLSENQVLSFNNEGKEKLGKGPIIICIDESSSMRPIQAESKAFCLALLFLAKRQKRDLAIIPFSSDIGETLYFLKGQASTEKIVSFSQSFLGGGTNYEKPLNEALNLLLKSKFNNADIIFVTDGSSFLPSSFIHYFCEVKNRRKFECTAIVLTNLFNAVDLNIVNRFSDYVIEVSDLLEAEEVFSIT